MILAILLLASFLRLFNLGTNPPSLYWEEVALGYDAYSIWKTGKDYHGNPWPIVAFESFGDYKPSGYFYVLAPFVGLFGLHDWVVKLPSALAGIATVYLIYLIVSNTSVNKKLGLAAAFVLTVMPWHVFISRVGFEVNVGLMWLALSLWLLLKVKHKPIFMLAAVIPLIISMYTYHGLRVVSPLMIMLTGVFFLPLKTIMKSKLFLASCLLFLGLLTPVIVQFRDPVVIQRFNEVNYFSISPAVAVTNQLRARYGNAWWARIVFHRYWFWGYELFQNGLTHFTPSFLFVRGDGNARHQNPNFGVLNWWTLPLIIASFLCLQKKQYRKLWWYGLLSLIISVIPASLSFPTPHALRALPSVIGWSLIIALGMLWLIQALKPGLRLASVAILMMAIIFETLQYWHDLWTNYPQKYSDSWQYGYKQAISFVTQRITQNEMIYLTRAYGRPSIYVMFYTQADPILVQQESKIVPKDQSELLRIGSWDFIKDGGIHYSWIINDVPITDTSYELQNTVLALDGQPLFYIYQHQ